MDQEVGSVKSRFARRNGSYARRKEVIQNSGFSIQKGLKAQGSRLKEEHPEPNQNLLRRNRSPSCASPSCVSASGRQIAAARAIDFTAEVNDSITAGPW